MSLRQRDLAAARGPLRGALEVAVAIGRLSIRREGLAIFAEILAAQGEAECALRVLEFETAQASLAYAPLLALPKGTT